MKQFRTILFAVIFMTVSFSAFSQVAINSDGTAPNSNAMLDVKATDKGFLPPRVDLDDVNTAAPLAGATAGMIIYNQGGDAPDGLYMWDGLKWTKLNNQGGGSTHYVGKLYGGGIVFYVDQTGGHGLIASLDDLDGGSGAAWSNIINIEIGASAQSMTDGASNTTAITGQAGHTSSAAKLCEDYAGGSFTDWYLPSNRELYLLASQDILIDQILDNDGDPSTNGFSQEYISPTYGRYWSSTEHHSLSAWSYYFYNGYSSNYYKNYAYRVRAVRAF